MGGCWKEERGGEGARAARCVTEDMPRRPVAGPRRRAQAPYATYSRRTLAQTGDGCGCVLHRAAFCGPSAPIGRSHRTVGRTHAAQPRLASCLVSPWTRWPVLGVMRGIGLCGWGTRVEAWAASVGRRTPAHSPSPLAAKRGRLDPVRAACFFVGGAARRGLGRGQPPPPTRHSFGHTALFQPRAGRRPPTVHTQTTRPHFTATSRRPPTRTPPRSPPPAPWAGTPPTCPGPR